MRMASELLQFTRFVSFPPFNRCAAVCSVLTSNLSTAPGEDYSVPILAAYDSRIRLRPDRELKFRFS
jgi:hypothetical protein